MTNTRMVQLIGAFGAGVGITLAAQFLIGSGGASSGAGEKVPATAAGKSGSTGGTPLRNVGVPESSNSSSSLSVGSNRKKGAESKSQEAKDKAKKAEEKRKEWLENFVEGSRKKSREQNAVQLAYLAEVLGLTPDQIASLEADLEADLEKRLEEAQEGGVVYYKKKNTQGDFLEKLLEGALTPDQQEAYAGLQERERANKVESRTMKRFADLPVALNLSEEQRDQVFDILAAEELESLNAPPNPAKEQIGMVTTFTAEGGGSVIRRSTGGGKLNSKESAERRREEKRQEVEQRVETLRPILNDRQLDVYRDHLQTRNGIRSMGTTLLIEDSKVQFEMLPN